LNGFLSFNYKDVAPPGLELHAFRLLPHCGLPPSLRFGAASSARRVGAARNANSDKLRKREHATRSVSRAGDAETQPENIEHPTPLRASRHSTPLSREQASNIELLPRPPSLRRWAFDARSRFIGVGCSMFPCIRAFAPAPWPKFFSTRKKGLNMFLNVKKIMPPFCGSITGQAAWHARLC
jgi:hypothetical protein